MKLNRLKALDIEEERELAGRLAGVLYLVGALTGVLLLVLPGVEVTNPLALLVVCFGRLRLGCDRRAGARLEQGAAVVSHISTGLGLPITAFVMGITGGAGSPALFYVFFVAVYCSWFYPPREAIPHLLGCAAVDHAPAALRPHALAQAPSPHAVIIIPTFAVLGWLIMGGKALLVELRDRAPELALRDPAHRAVEPAGVHRLPGRAAWRGTRAGRPPARRPRRVQGRPTPGTATPRATGCCARPPAARAT